MDANAILQGRVALMTGSGCGMAASCSAPISFPQVEYLMVAEVGVGPPGLYAEIRPMGGENARQRRAG